METLKVIVGNTVDFIVDVEGMSNSPDEIFLKIYDKQIFGVGFTDELLSVVPTGIADGSAKFVFDTDTIANIPATKYGRFYVNDNGKKINAYFKIKFVY